MSFSLTTRQFRERTKTVTRRLGWLDLEPGELLCGCEKVMGRRGAPLVRLGIIVVVSARRELLNLMSSDEDYGDREARLEGFPEMQGHEFVGMFSDNMKVPVGEEITRIEYRYVPGGSFEKDAT